jgi:hypothetical protein
MNKTAATKCEPNSTYPSQQCRNRNSTHPSQQCRNKGTCTAEKDDDCDECNSNRHEDGQGREAPL